VQDPLTLDSTNWFPIETWLKMWSNIFKDNGELFSVVMGVTWIDLLLGLKVIGPFLNDGFSKESEKLFVRDAFFSRKIEHAYQLGLISRDLRDDLNIIKDIRNNMVHPSKSGRFLVTECTLNNKENRKWFGTLKGHFKKFLNKFSYLRNKKGEGEYYKKGILGDFQMITGGITHLFLFYPYSLTLQAAKRELIYSNDIKKILDKNKSYCNPLITNTKEDNKMDCYPVTDKKVIARIKLKKECPNCKKRKLNFRVESDGEGRFVDHLPSFNSPCKYIDFMCLNCNKWFRITKEDYDNVDNYIANGE